MANAMDVHQTRKPIVRWLLAAAAVCAVLALWMWDARSKDVYEGGIVTYYAEGYDPQNWTEENRGALVAQADVEHLNPGRYTLTMTYTAQADGGRVEAVDLYDGTVFASAPYTAGEQQTLTLSFTLEQPLLALKVYSYAGDGALEVGSGSLRSDGPVYTDAWWLLLLAVGGILLAVRAVRRCRRGQPREAQLLALATVFSLPFMTDHLPWGMDLEFHLSRIYGIGLALREGQFPVRLNFEFSGGYLSSTMYPELFLYPSGLMCAGGASVLLATKVLLILTTFATVYVGYYAMRQMLGDTGGMVFTLLYLCCPYRLNDIYSRAALGEALAMAFVPLAIVGVWQLLQERYRAGFWNAMLGITCLLQSHVITTFLVGVFGVLYGVVVLLVDGKRFFADRRRPLTIAAAAGCTLLVNAWYLVAFLHFSSWDLHIFHEPGALGVTRLSPWQMFMNTYTTMGDSLDATTQGEMPLSIGLALLLGTLLFLYRRLTRPAGAADDAGDRIQRGLFASGWVLLWLTSTLFPWPQLSNIPAVDGVFSKIQFIWRLLILAAPLLTAGTAQELIRQWRAENRLGMAASVCIVTLAIWSATYASSQYLFFNRTLMPSNSGGWNHTMFYDGQYLLTETTIGAVGYQLQQGIGIIGSAEVTDWNKQGSRVTLTFHRYDPAEPTVFRVPLYNYGMYRATLSDGRQLPIRSDEHYNLVEVLVTDGTTDGTITVAYHAPRRFRLGEGVTLLSVAALLWLRRRGRRSAPPRLADKSA